MCITTVSFIRYMNYHFFIKRPMQMVEFKLNMILDANPHLMNVLDKNISYPLFNKYSYIFYLKPYFSFYNKFIFLQLIISFPFIVLTSFIPNCFFLI